MATDPNTLRKRYGHSKGRMTAEDRADLEAAQKGLKQFQEHPESAISSEEIKRQFGIK